MAPCIDEKKGDTGRVASLSEATQLGSPTVAVKASDQVGAMLLSPGALPLRAASPLLGAKGQDAALSHPLPEGLSQAP